MQRTRGMWREGVFMAVAGKWFARGDNGGGGGQCKQNFTKNILLGVFRTKNSKQFSRSGCAQPASAPLPMNLRMQDVCPRMLLA